MIRVPVCARVSRVCPGSPRCLFTGTVRPCVPCVPCVSRLPPVSFTGTVSTRRGLGTAVAGRERCVVVRVRVDTPPVGKVFRAWFSTR